MIEFKEVSKRYHGKLVVDNISFTINDHEVFGIIGPSGAGKSTLLKLINQLEHLDGGTLEIDGQQLKMMNSENVAKMRQRIGVIFQQFNLLDHLNVYDNIALPLKLQKKDDDKRVKSLLEFIGMQDHAHKYPAHLSGGQKQRVAIARALITRPQFLLCDEPTSALDTQTTAEFLKLLKRVHEDFKTTIVIVTHDLNVAKAICDRVAILENGLLQHVVDVMKSPIDSVEDFTHTAVEALTRD